jgi:hypothetical protein
MDRWQQIEALFQEAVPRSIAKNPPTACIHSHLR